MGMAIIKVTPKLNNIQVLRAFAALVVVVFHTGFKFPLLRPFGALGVDVFFVISGYIMARILDSDDGSSSQFFFRRRILRIVPPYWFFTLFLFCIALVIPQFMRATRADGLELLKSLAFIPYIKGSGLMEPLLFVGWSLNYEMFFYLALAIGILLSRRHAVWIGSALILATMFGCKPFAGTWVVARFYSNFIVAEFVFGVLCYYLCRTVSNQTARRFRRLALAVCFASAFLLIAVQAILPQLNVSRIFTFGILSFLLVASASLLSQGNWDTKLRWLVLIGDASYVLYLTHPYCEYSIHRLLARRIHWLAIDTATGAPVAVALSTLLAVLIHVYAERPVVRFLNRRFGGKRKSVEFSDPASA
jgi:peptidoglycan/LPS O-acetylase OafA/YrhL